MSDPRNVAHNKKVKQEKEHHHEAPAPKVQPRTNPADDHAGTTPGSPESAPADLEKSQAVLSKLKEMEFHSRANIETLAGRLSRSTTN